MNVDHRLGRYRVEWAEAWSVRWRFYGSYDREDRALDATRDIRANGHDARIIARFVMLEDPPRRT